MKVLKPYIMVVMAVESNEKKNGAKLDMTGRPPMVFETHKGSQVKKGDILILKPNTTILCREMTDGEMLFVKEDDVMAVMNRV